MTYKTSNGHDMITTVANIQYFQIVNVRHICSTKILHLNGRMKTGIREYWWELASVINQILPTKPLDSSIVALFKSCEG